MVDCWKEVTLSCEIACLAVKEQDTRPMVCLESFSLHESMSATELMDPKMDQCHGFGELHSMKVVDLFSLDFEGFSWETVVGLILFLLKNEVSFYSGNSILETTHRCYFLWKETLLALAHKRSLLERVVFTYCRAFLRSLARVLSSVLTADIYEDEDFCPAFKAYLYDCEEETADLIKEIVALMNEINQCEDIIEEFKRVIHTSFEARIAFIEWAEDLEALIRVTLTESTRQLRLLRGKVGTQESMSTLLDGTSDYCIQPLSFDSFKDVLQKGETLSRTLRMFKGQVEELMNSWNTTEDQFFGRVYNMIRRDFLPRLYMNGPRRLEEDFSVAIQLEKLLVIPDQIRQIYEILIQDHVSKEPGKIQIELPFEYLIGKCDFISRQKFHVIARSYLVSFLHIVGIFLDKCLWNSVLHWKIPSAIRSNSNLPLEWIQGNVTAASWEILRCMSINRNRTFSRLEQIFSLWGGLSAESLYLDEKLSEDLGLNTDPRDSIYWFATWLAIPTTTLMDFQMKLMIEMQIFDIFELDYFYWYWDFIYSTRLHACEKLKIHSQDFKNEEQPFLYSNTSIWRGCGQLCRGIFRVIMACKYLKIIPGEFSTSSYSSMAVTFANRFKNFQEIINPSALNYHEFINTVNKDLATLSPQEGKIGRCRSALQIVNSAIICFQNAKLLFEDSKGKTTFDQGFIINLIKTSIASQLQTTKLKKFLESCDQNTVRKGQISTEMNFSYTSYFGVLEFRFDNV